MQPKDHFFPVMAVFLLFSLAVFSEAIVMDQKVKESFVMDTASAICNYNTHYKDHPKYWCRGYFRNYCNIIAFTPNSTERVALRDTGSQLIVTVSCLTKEDTGWYWCGIQRDFARDEMDFTELIVSDNRAALTSEFWSGEGLSGNQNRSCRASQVVHKADRSRMSILIICILITGLGIISIISHLSKRRRRQRSRRGKGQVRSLKNSQISPVIPTPLKPQRHPRQRSVTTDVITIQAPTSSGYGNVGRQHFRAGTRRPRNTRWCSTRVHSRENPKANAKA